MKNIHNKRSDRVSDADISARVLILLLRQA